MELKIYLRMLQKGWWLIVLGALTGLIISLLASYFATPQYVSTARFIITPSLSLKTSKDVVDSLNTLDRASVVATYAEVMNSERVFADSIASMQSSPAVMKDYAVNAVVLPSSSVLELTVSGPNPNAAAELANTIGKQTIQFAESINFIFDMNFLDAAVPAVAPFSPQPVRDAGLSLGLGAIFGALLAIVGEQLRVPLETYRQYFRMDSESGVFNVSHFRHLLAQEINDHPDDSMTIGLIEIEGLKDLLETLPPVGLKKLLHKITQTLQNELRGNDVIGRWNDTGFSVILPDTPGSAAPRTFDRIYEALSVPVDLSQYDVTVDLHPYIGAAVYSNNIKAQELIEKMEGSLEQAHRSGNDKPIYLWDIKSPFWKDAEK